MTKIHTSTLEGELLTEWVTRAQGFEFDEDNQFFLGDSVNGFWWYYKKGLRILVNDNGETYRPDINSTQAMDLQKKFLIDVNKLRSSEGWCANVFPRIATVTISETPEVAICRTVVASVFGDYVEIEQ